MMMMMMMMIMILHQYENYSASASCYLLDHLSEPHMIIRQFLV